MRVVIDGERGVDTNAIGNTAPIEVDADTLTIAIVNASGAHTIWVITPQYSYDETVWYNYPAVTILAGTASPRENLSLAWPYPYGRLRVTTQEGGVSTIDCFLIQKR